MTKSKSTRAELESDAPAEAKELVRQLQELSEELADLRLLVDDWQAHSHPDYDREWTAA